MKKITNKIKGLSDTNMLLLITVIVFFVMYLGAMAFVQSNFLTPQNLFNMLNDKAPLIIAACGMSLVMITGGIDISIGGVIGLVTMVCAVYLDFHNGNVVVALLISIGIGLAFGIVQGYLVAYLNIQPFIVTLAGMFFARGLTTIIHSNPFNVENEAFMAAKDTRIYLMQYEIRAGHMARAYIEPGVIVAICTVILFFVVLKWTKMGRNFYAVGGNRQSALMLGINVKNTVFISHIICGLFAGIAGFIYILHCGSGAVTNASGMEMDAIASSIIGGTMLTGGVGNIIGTFFGVMSLATIQNIVNSVGLDDAWWTKITVGAMLCIFLVVQSVIMAKKRKQAKG